MVVTEKVGKATSKITPLHSKRLLHLKYLFTPTTHEYFKMAAARVIQLRVFTPVHVLLEKKLVSGAPRQTVSDTRWSELLVMSSAPPWSRRS